MFWRNALIFSVALSWVGIAVAYEPCGELNNAFGPFDYRSATIENKRLVEGAHFTSEVENLVRGRSGPLGGDLDYTLRVFPNHPRALMAMVKLAAKEKREKPKGARYAVPCWFDRAIRFQPDDGAVRLVYGLYLLKKGDATNAVGELEKAQVGIGDDPNLNYNLGLAYFQVGDFSKSLEFAKKAYSQGFPLPGLKNKLKKAGKWTD